MEDGDPGKNADNHDHNQDLDQREAVRPIIRYAVGRLHGGVRSRCRQGHGATAAGETLAEVTNDRGPTLRQRNGYCRTAKWVTPFSGMNAMIGAGLPSTCNWLGKNP